MYRLIEYIKLSLSIMGSLCTTKLPPDVYIRHYPKFPCGQIQEVKKEHKEKLNLAYKKISILKYELLQYLKTLNGDWSIYVKNLNTDESMTINDKPMYAASLIKLYTMAATYQKVDEDVIEENSIEKSVENMIENSSNSSFNTLAVKTGVKYVNDWCKENGYDETVTRHGLSPSDNNFGHVTEGENQTSVVDCGNLLESIYRNECVDKIYSQEMSDILKVVTNDKAKWYRNRIPEGVPEDIIVANKTGDVSNYCHDCAIVYAPECDYIICIMSHVDGAGYSSGTYEIFQKISEMTYDFFNN